MKGVIADVSLPSESGPLGRAFRGCDGLELELERCVAHGEGAVPFVWTSGVPIEAVEAAFEADPTVENYRPVSTARETGLYRLELNSEGHRLCEPIFAEDGVVLAARADADGWEFQLLFPDRDALARAYATLRDADLSPKLESIRGIENGRRGLYGLTDDQFETLELAYGAGYYEIPRGVTLCELADVMGVSHQALSERLRRGHRNLVEQVLAECERINRVEEGEDRAGALTRPRP